MKFSILAISLLTSGSLAFAPGSSLDKGVSQHAFRVTPMVTSTSQRSGIHKIQLSMAKHSDKGTRGISKNTEPTIRKWKQNPDGSITGIISGGSPDYVNGNSITTSTIREKNLSAGQVITTITGSKYKLEGKGTPLDEPFKEIFSIRNRFAPKENVVTPKKGSMFFASPKNVPIMRKWKQNANGSISGIISGSDEYKEDEFVTTSPMKGTPTANKVATTKNGSKYFLEGVGTTLKDPDKAARTVSVANNGGGRGGNDNAAVSISIPLDFESGLFSMYFTHRSVNILRIGYWNWFGCSCSSCIIWLQRVAGTFCRRHRRCTYH